MKGDLSVRRLVVGLAAVLLVPTLLVGCERHPSGEGEWRTHVQGPGEPFGSGVFVISGDGVLDVAGDAGTEVWTARTGEDELRVVAIQRESTGTLRLRIRVRDLSDPTPTVGLIQLSGLDDEPVPIEPGHRIHHSR